MGNVITLKCFLERYGESMAEKVAQELQVIHEPRTNEEPEIVEILNGLKKKPFAAQAEIVKAVVKSLLGGNRGVYTVCECGTGKTLMALSVAKVLADLVGIRRVLVLCPPHLVPKWIQEIRDSIQDAKAYNLNGKDALERLRELKGAGRPQSLEFYVMGRERAKTGYLWRPSYVRRMKLMCCPRCGQELLDVDGLPLPLFERTTQGDTGNALPAPTRYGSGDMCKKRERTVRSKKYAASSCGSRTPPKGSTSPTCRQDTSNRR